MTSSRILYAERTRAPPWIFALLWGLCIVGVGVAIYELLQAPAPAESAEAILAVGALILFPLLISLLFGRLDVEVHTDSLCIAFGPLGLVRTRIPFAEIQSLQSLTYRPLRDFGGWGLRLRGRRTAWTIRGNRALCVHLRSGRQIHVGSRFPQRLEERVQMAWHRSQSAGGDSTE